MWQMMGCEVLVRLRNRVDVSEMMMTTLSFRLWIGTVVTKHAVVVVGMKMMMMMMVVEP
jgi:hypothetical protein